MNLTRRALGAGLAGVAGLGVARAQAPALKIVFQHGTAHLPVTYAEATGLFARAGAAAGLSDFVVSGFQVASSTAVNDALLSGSADLGVYGATGLLIAWDRTRQNLRVGGVCGLALTPYTLVAIRPDLHSTADFGEGDRIAVTSTIGPHAILLRMAAERTFGPGQHARLDPLMVTLAHPDAVNALRSRQITAYVATPPFTAVVLADPRVRPLWTSRDILGGPATGAAIGGTRRVVEGKPREVAAVIAALDQAIAEIAADPRRAAAIYHAAEGQGMSLRDVVTALEDRDQSFDLAPRGTEIFASFMARVGLMRNRIDSWRDVFFPALHGRNGS